MIKRNQGLPLALTCIHFDHKNVEKNVALTKVTPNELFEYKYYSFNNLNGLAWENTEKCGGHRWFLHPICTQNPVVSAGFF